MVFAPREELLTPAGLERVLERHAVTGLELPTPYWNEWMDDLECLAGLQGSRKGCVAGYTG